AADDQVGRLVPLHVAEHHLAGEDDRAGVHLVLVGVLGRGAVRRLEHGVPGDVVDVPARGDADAADLCGQRVAQVVAVQVGRGDDVELLRTGEDLLKRDVGDGVLHHDAIGQLAPGPAVDLLGAEEVLGDLVPPVAEGAFGELHDVALVNESHALALLLDRGADGAVYQAFGAEIAHRLDANADLHRKIAARGDDRLELRLPAFGGL